MVSAQYYQYLGSLFFSVEKGNNCILIEGAQVALIQNFLSTSDGIRIVKCFSRTIFPLSTGLFQARLSSCLKPISSYGHYK